MFVLDTLFTFLLYLSLSLLLLLEEEDELVFPIVVPAGALPLGFPGFILVITAGAILPIWLTMLLLPPALLLPVPLLAMADDDDVGITLVDPFEAPDDFLCFDDDDDDDGADEELPCSPGNRLLDFILLLVLPPVILLPLGCCCRGGGGAGGSNSFSGDDGPSLEFVS